ncbi:conserved hypothetical protein [Candidatus Nitrosotenuis uzonensis]|uniref:Uncharacterized protein n=1 Tax=Candidatus Nitrosotenuis uzonensis TaxID=1407055 RepID=A0A812EWB5_9ARCH|nr:conserved hypothetical protein [Candidatus Nitrosotenuis uzonensis]
MNENHKNLIFAVLAIVIVVPSILIVHNYVYYVSHLEKIEFEQIAENCDAACKSELENKGFRCEAKGYIGYACVPPIDPQRIEQRRDYWDQLSPSSYGYLDLVYNDKDFAIGFLRDFEIINENQIKAIFKHNLSDKYGDESILPKQNYENTRILNVGDTFIPRCNNQYLFVYKLHDIVISEDVSYVIFVYRIGTTDIERCVFPETLENSFNVRFDI